ncbi:hypothetical protein KC19_2G223700 [Ceratodon purpureus]|uniref:Roadblock/LAMTOR2 domain-containing protein n=1 Tax=Ceratodon purpureus TaxID=3225 RepID=A0A8T0IYY0_CERPU|nr:hypothetical protein KC19_2G223700 [Ceratodon purpureus]
MAAAPPPDAPPPDAPPGDPNAPAVPAKKPKPPKPIKRSDSVLARDKQQNFSRNEVEHTIKRIASHRGIVGTLIVDKHCVPIRSSMDKASTQQYAAFITPLLHRAQMICLSHDKANPLTMFRLRTNTTEVIVTPDENYYLIAVQKVSHAADAT